MKLITKSNKISNDNKKNNQIKRDNKKRTIVRLSKISTLLVVLLSLLINIFLDSSLKDKLRFDFTSNKLMSLSEESRNLLNSLEHNIEIIPLGKKEDFYQNSNLNFINELLNEYAKNSNSKIRVEYIDPVSNPQIIKKLDPENVKNIQKNALAVYSKDTNKVKVLNPNNFINQQIDQRTYQSYITGYSAEANISGAIQYVDSLESKKIYFTQGHNEDQYKEKYKILSQVLENNNFTYDEMPAKQLENIPEDANIIFMLNPKTDINSSEIKVLEEYLKSGGSLIVTVDYGKNSFDNLNALLSKNNIKITDNRVSETNNNIRLADDPYTFLVDEEDSYINSKKYATSVLVSSARSIDNALNDKDWIKTSTILQSSKDSVSEINGNSKEKSEKGHKIIALASENTGYIGGKDSSGKDVKLSSRVIVFGNSMMFSDTIFMNFMQQTRNLVLLNNSLSWLGRNEDNSLLIRPVTPVTYAFNVEKYHFVPYIAVFFIVFVPLFFVVLAILVYRKRKNM